MRAIAYICALIIYLVSYEAMASDISPLQQAKIDHRTGYHYHMAKDHDEAMKWYIKGASAGLAKSEFAVARLLTIDADGPKNYTAALPWIIRAAQPRKSPQGYGFEDSQKYAREMLDWICRNGVASFPETMPQSKDSYCLYRRGRKLYYGSKKHGVKRDYVAARNYLHQALEKNEPRAATHLMWIYGKGLGTEQNPELYQKMMRIAAEVGDGDAIMALTAQEMEQLSHDEYMANLNRAANDGHHKANKLLGDIYLKRKTDQDLERALTHYFLTGRTNFSAGYSIFSKKTIFKDLLENPEAKTLFDAAKTKAERIVEENNLRKSKRKAIARSYRAISSKHAAVQKAGRVRSVEEKGFYLFLVMLAIAGFMRPLRLGIFLGTHWLYRVVKF